MACNFRCHSRSFVLAAGSDAARLACEQTVSPDLRMRSRIHWWSHSSGTMLLRSNHEAVCTKANGTRWHGISFGSHSKWSHRATRNCRLALQHGLADACTALTLDDLPERFRLGPDGTNRTVLGTAGIGWLKWKPWILAHHMEHRMEHRDVLLWFDNDAPIGARSLAPLFCIGQNAVSGIAPFHQSCFLDGQYSNRRLTDALNATSAELSTAQVWAGLLVLRKEEAVVQFLKEWASWAPLFENDPTSERGHPSNRERPEFIVHRHDQSCLSLLAKRRRIKTYPVPISSHDPADMWFWDAGFCRVDASLDTLGYAPYYGPLEAVEKLCQQHTHQSALAESYLHQESGPSNMLASASRATTAATAAVAQVAPRHDAAPVGVAASPPTAKSRTDSQNATGCAACMMQAAKQVLEG